jgi:hypothetical protein
MKFFGGLMKKFLALLLVCIFVVSIAFSLSSCKWWRNRNQDDPTDNPTDTPTDDPTTDTPDDGSGLFNGKIKLPAISVPGSTPEE